MGAPSERVDQLQLLAADLAPPLSLISFPVDLLEFGSKAERYVDMALGLFGGGWVERQDPQLEPLHLQMLWVPPSWCDVSSHKTLADHSLVELRSVLQNTQPLRKGRNKERLGPRRSALSLPTGNFSGCEEKFSVHRGPHNRSSFSVSLDSRFRAPRWPEALTWSLP